VKRITSLLVVSLLIGCGGGGGGENSSSGSVPIVTSHAATSITPTSAILNGTTIPNGLQTQSWFEYGADSALATYTSSPKQDEGNGQTSQAANITWNGLTAGTTYYFRLCAENGKGTSKGLIINFTTSSPGDLPTVSTLAATSLGATTATLNGNVAANGLTTNVWFEWGTDPALATYTSTVFQSIGSGTTSQLFNSSLSGLSTGTTYYFRVAASNLSGTNKGAIASFTPGAAPAVTTVGATQVGATNATLSGSVEPNGLTTNCWFEWGTDSAFTTFAPTQPLIISSSVNGFARFEVLTGLSSGTTYYYRIAASNSSGTNKGSILSFTTTTPGAAPSVTTMAATSVGTTGATLNGNVSPNSLATTAWFEWGTDSTLTVFSSTSTQSVGSGTASQLVSFPLSGLSAGTTYYFRVAASNSSGTNKGAILRFSSSFSVVSTYPGNNGTEIPLNNTIKITFNKDVNPSTMSNGITARSYIGDLPGTVSYDPSTKTATYTPGTPFAPLTDYTVTIGTSVKSINGEALSVPYQFRFTTITAFVAHDFTLGNDYLMNASKVAEGTHCYIYLEKGKTVSQMDLDRIKNNFDSTIYPSILGNFGSEPNPGADGLPKIFIVLLDIRDGYVPGGGYIAGYFSPRNEYSNADTYPLGFQSNQKEVFFMDVYPGNPSSPSFEKSLAHEYQHMVHWEQKTNRLGLNDDLWLNEAMSEIAPFYAGFGPDYSRVATFEKGNNRSDSLTVWNQSLADYGVVYMWSQYMADRFPSGVFKNILTSPSTGIASVDSYLNSAYPGVTFSTVFRDWSIAVFSGKDTTWTNHPEWSYKTINTREGIYDGITIPGIFTPNNLNVSPLPSLPPWSVDFYWYTPKSAYPIFTLNLGPPPNPQASFINLINNALFMSFDMIPGQPYSYDNAAIVVLQNVSGSTTSGSTSSNLSIQGSMTTILSPLEKLKAISESATSKKMRENSGEPTGICMHDYLLEQEKVMREMIRKKKNVW